MNPRRSGAIAADLDAVIDGLERATLSAYEVQTAPPVSGPFGDHELYGAAPLLPGASVIQLLQIGEALGVCEEPPGSEGFVHDIAMS